MALYTYGVEDDAQRKERLLLESYEPITARTLFFKMIHSANSAYYQNLTSPSQQLQHHFSKKTEMVRPPVMKTREVGATHNVAKI